MSSRAPTSRARVAQQERQLKRMVVAIGSFIAVIAVIVVFIAVKASDSKSTSPSVPSAPVLVPAAALAGLAALPPPTLAAAARRGVAGGPRPFVGPPPPGQASKPEVFYVGAEFCPYCAAERWALVTALEHFGQFAGLGETHSASDDVDPDTPTFSFYGATYTSDYLTFSSVEQTTNQRRGNGYAPLQSLTADQASYVSHYGTGGIPFISLAGKFTASTQYDPAILHGQTFDAVAAAAVDPASRIGSTIQAAAGLLVASLCQVTNGLPTAVCSPFGGTAGGG